MLFHRGTGALYHRRCGTGALYHRHWGTGALYHRHSGTGGPGVHLYHRHCGTVGPPVAAYGPPGGPWLPGALGGPRWLWLRLPSLSSGLARPHCYYHWNSPVLQVGACWPEYCSPGGGGVHVGDGAGVTGGRGEALGPAVEVSGVLVGVGAGVAGGRGGAL